MIAAANTSRVETPGTWRDLMAIIVEAYHDSLRATLPRLERLAERVACEHRAPIHVLDWLLREFSALADSLKTHLLQQEGHLFPMIRHVCESVEPTAWLCHLDNTLEELMDEATRDDQEAVAGVKRAEDCIRGMACARSEPLVAKLVKGIRELRQDLEEHVKLETNVLFPVVREMLHRNQGQDSKTAPGGSGVLSNLPYRSGAPKPEITPDPFSDSLKSVLHALRDRLSVDKAIALGMQLPRHVRRLYYGDWQHRWDRAAKLQTGDFLHEIAESHTHEPNRNAAEIVRDIFHSLAEQMPTHEVEEVRKILPPGEIRSLWPTAAQLAPMAELIVANLECG